MSKVDFTKLANPISDALDTDYMDIYRQIDDDPERDLYASNVKCHIAIKTSDNPDPSSVDVQPIITSLRIHCPNWVDLKNNDYIVAKKSDLNGNILNFYEGIIGEPATSMARQSVTLAMKSDKKIQEPEPVPPPIDESVTIQLNYLDLENNKIQDSIEQTYKMGDNVTISPLNIDNYTLDRIELNGEIVENVVIDDIQQDYTVDFYYQIVTNITSIRILVDGDYTKDNGTLAYGLHLYVPIAVLSANNNTLELASNKFNHDEIGTITIKTGDKFRDNLENWHIITDITQVDDGYVITFADTEPVQAYITHWYG